MYSKVLLYTTYKRNKICFTFYNTATFLILIFCVKHLNFKILLKSFI